MISCSLWASQNISMSRSMLNLRKFPSVSISNLPCLLITILIFGGLYFISFLISVNPFPTACGLWICSESNDPQGISLPIHPQSICNHRESLSGDVPFNYSHLPSLTIFTAPTKPFSDAPAPDPQYQALLSWLSLLPSPKIVLLGNDPSFYKVAKQLCDDVSVEPNIDHNLIRGTQQVHSMFARAHQANTELTMVINAETMLFQDIMEALHKTHERYIHEEHWILLGRPWHVGANTHSVVSFTKIGPSDLHNRLRGFLTSCIEIPNYVRPQGTGLYNSRQDIAYWVWNTPSKAESPFKYSVLPTTRMPPFSNVIGTFEDWILEHLITRSKPNVIIDGSEAITSVRLATSSLTNINATSSGQEAYINALLSNEDGGPPHNHSTSFISSPLRLVPCAKPKVHTSILSAPLWLMRRAKPRVHNLCFVEPKREDDGTQMNTGHGGHSGLESATISMPYMSQGHYYTLDELLPHVADHNKLVVMVGGTSNYKEMLSSFICRAQSLGVENLLIAAFDKAMLDYAYKKGYPVYLETAPKEYEASIGSDPRCKFASQCFKRVSKLKSRSVLRVLKKGYSVLWSDMDIVWFQNPLPKLYAFGPGTLPIQSDEPNENKPENSILGANSGFYLARPEEGTIHAFEAIVSHALNSSRTEQPSFYIVLCGQKGDRRVGHRECVFNGGGPSSNGRVGVRTVFLDHQQFPNGHVYGHWRAPNASKSCQKRGCILLHNNYIAGKENKWRRLIKHGLWYYDVKNEMCIQPWHPLQRLPISKKMDVLNSNHTLYK